MTDQQEMDDFLHEVLTKKPKIMADEKKKKKEWTDQEKLAEIARILNKGKNAAKMVKVAELEKWGVTIKFDKSSGEIKDVTMKQTKKKE